MTEPDLYRILHVDPDAPEEIIRASYLAMMKRLKNHPDLGGEHTDAILINQAYETLTNAQKRSEYDRRRGQQQPVDVNPQEPSGVARPSHTGRNPILDCPFCGAAVRIRPESGEPTCPECSSPLETFTRDAADPSGQRAVDRFPKRQTIQFLSQPEQTTPHTGETLDISPNGMQFLTNHPLSLEQVIQIDCAVCSAIARVAYVSLAQEPHVAGVEFLTRRFKRDRGTFISTRS